MIESIPADYAIAVLIGYMMSPIGLTAAILTPPAMWAGWMAFLRKIN